jgi:hypothetical protein
VDRVLDSLRRTDSPVTKETSYDNPGGGFVRLCDAVCYVQHTEKGTLPDVRQIGHSSGRTGSRR